MALVSAAGPISNVLVAVIVSSISLLVTAYEINLPQWLSEMFRLMVSVNISLAAFNFLPLPPLDGFALAIGVLPQRAAATFASIESFGPGILLLLIFAPSIIRVDLLDLILQPFIAVVAALVGLGVTLVAYFLVV
jgi:Zn-dependent protease